MTPTQNLYAWVTGSALVMIGFADLMGLWEAL